MSRKIGILSMQKVINYGSVLQAYALKQMLLNAGADNVEFIDIEPGRYLEEFKHKSSFSKLLKRKPFTHPIRFIKDILFTRKYHKSVKAGWPWLGISEGRMTSQNYDMVVIGSDEVFNVCQPSEWGLSPQLFGKVDGARRIISYAGSFGNTTIEDLKRLNICSEIASYMSHMDAISVRDANSKKIVENLIATTVVNHIDPVLAYGYKSEISGFQQQKQGEYIVIYTYHNRISDKSEITAIRNFAKANGLKLVSVMCRYSWCDKCTDIQSPLHVLEIFKNAAYIVTDTFHGTIFSIITHSKFATLIRQSNQNKLTSLLRDATLESRAVDCPQNLSIILKTDIDYKRVEGALAPLRGNANDYLKEQLCFI